MRTLVLYTGPRVCGRVAADTGRFVIVVTDKARRGMARRSRDNAFQPQRIGRRLGIARLPILRLSLPPRHRRLECLHLGQFTEAVEAARLAVRTERSEPGLQANLALALLLAGDVDEALKMTEDLIEKDKGGWYFVRLKGEVLRAADRNADAANRRHGGGNRRRRHQSRWQAHRQSRRRRVRTVPG